MADVLVRSAMHVPLAREGVRRHPHRHTERCTRLPDEARGNACGAASPQGPEGLHGVTQAQGRGRERSAKGLPAGRWYRRHRLQGVSTPAGEPALARARRRARRPLRRSAAAPKGRFRTPRRSCLRWEAASSSPKSLRESRPARLLHHVRRSHGFRPMLSSGAGRLLDFGRSG